MDLIGQLTGRHRDKIVFVFVGFCDNSRLTSSLSAKKPASSIAPSLWQIKD